MYDAALREAGQLHLLISKIADRGEQLRQQLLDIEVTLSDLDVAKARCADRLSALRECV